MPKTSWLDDNWYPLGAWLIGGVTFVGAWIYAIATYGLFLGLGLGWLPAGIIGVIVGLLWPLIAVVIIGVAILLSMI